MFLSSTTRDGGQAWIIVLGSMGVMIFGSGLSRAYGAMLPEVVHYYDSSYASASWMAGILVFGMRGYGALANPLAEHYGTRAMVMGGGVVMTASLLASYFATSVTFLVISFGGLAGLGLGAMFSPSIVIISKYFQKKRALATTIAFSGNGISAFILPPMIGYAIDAYTLPGSLIVLAAFSMQSIVCGALFIDLDKLSANSDDLEKHGTLVRRDTVQSMMSVMSDMTEFSVTADELCAREEECESVPEAFEPNMQSDIEMPTRKVSRSVSEDLTGQGVLMVGYRKKSAILGEVVLGQTNIELENNNKCSKIINDAETSFALQRKGSVNAISMISDCEKKLNTEEKVRSKSVGFVSLSVEQKLELGKTSDINSVYEKNAAKLTDPSSQLKCLEGVRDNPSYWWECLCLDKLLCQCSRTDGRSSFFDATLFRDGTFILYCTIAMLTFASMNGMFQIFVSFAEDNGIERHTAELMFAVNGGVNIFGRTFFGWVTDRQLVSPFLIHAFLNMAQGVLIIGIYFCNDALSLWIISALLGILASNSVALTGVLLSDIFGVQKLHSVYGFTCFFEGSTGLYMPFLLGLLRDVQGNWHLGLFISGSFSIAACLLTITEALINKRIRRSPR